jgi:hypothetical protein
MWLGPVLLTCMIAGCAQPVSTPHAAVSAGLSSAAASTTPIPVIPRVASFASATPAPGVHVACPDMVHGDPGLIDFVGDLTVPPPPASIHVAAVVRCEVTNRVYPGVGSWQVEVAEVSHANPSAFLAQLRLPSIPADGACGMGSNYGYPWFALIEANGVIDRPPMPSQGCGPMPTAVAALDGLTFTVTDIVRIASTSTPLVSAPASLQPVPSSGASKLPNYTPPDVTSAPRVSEIFASHESPLTQAEFKVNNAWQGPGPKVGQWLVVYAGESMTDQLPALLIYALPTDPNAPGQDPSIVGLYRDAQASAALQISAANGPILTIDAVSATGSVASHQTFDTTTRTFGAPLR